MNVEKLKEFVSNFLGKRFVYNSSFSNTYDDDEYDLEVKLSLDTIENKKVSIFNEDFCKFELVIYFKVENITISLGEESESGMLEDDVPSWIWDELRESYEDNIYEFMPIVCPTIKLIF